MPTRTNSSHSSLFGILRERPDGRQIEQRLGSKHAENPQGKPTFLRLHSCWRLTNRPWLLFYSSPLGHLDTSTERGWSGPRVEFGHVDDPTLPRTLPQTIFPLPETLHWLYCCGPDRRRAEAALWCAGPRSGGIKLPGSSQSIHKLSARGSAAFRPLQRERDHDFGVERKLLDQRHRSAV